MKNTFLRFQIAFNKANNTFFLERESPTLKIWKKPNFDL